MLLLKWIISILHRSFLQFIYACRVVPGFSWCRHDHGHWIIHLIYWFPVFTFHFLQLWRLILKNITLQIILRTHSRLNLIRQLLLKTKQITRRRQNPLISFLIRLHRLNFIFFDFYVIYSKQYIYLLNLVFFIIYICCGCCMNYFISF